MFSKRTDWKLTPNAFTAAQQDARAAGREVLDLTASNPTRVGLNYDADTILSSLSPVESLDYDPQPKGLLAARQAVAAYYLEQHDTYDVDPEHIVLATSTSEAYSHIFRLLCNSQDQVLVPKPSYRSEEHTSELQSLTNLVCRLLLEKKKKK